jgi:hypothetical protein
LSKAAALASGKPADDPQSRIAAMAMMGSLGFFIRDRERERALRTLGWRQFSDDKLEMLQATLWAQLCAGLAPASAG